MDECSNGCTGGIMVVAARCGLPCAVGCVGLHVELCAQYRFYYCGGACGVAGIDTSGNGDGIFGDGGLYDDQYYCG